MKTLATLKILILQILLLMFVASANVFAYGRNTPLQGYYNCYNEKPQEPKKKSTEDKHAFKSAP